VDEGEKPRPAPRMTALPFPENAFYFHTHSFRAGVEDQDCRVAFGVYRVLLAMTPPPSPGLQFLFQFGEVQEVRRIF